MKGTELKEYLWQSGILLEQARRWCRRSRRSWKAYMDGKRDLPPELLRLIRLEAGYLESDQAGECWRDWRVYRNEIISPVVRGRNWTITDLYWYLSELDNCYDKLRDMRIETKKLEAELAEARERLAEIEERGTLEAILIYRKPATSTNFSGESTSANFSGESTSANFSGESTSANFSGESTSAEKSTATEAA